MSATFRRSEKWDKSYLYDERSILESIERLKKNFPQMDLLYSIKCSADPFVLHGIFQQGFGADAASAGEVQLAHETGLTADRIYFPLPGKA